MLDLKPTQEYYEANYLKASQKQLVMASCMDQLKGTESIDSSLEEKLRECVYRSFNVPDKTIYRFKEMFPDMRISESKL